MWIWSYPYGLDRSLNPDTTVGLVKVSKANGIASDGSIYEIPAKFIDDHSLASNRIFGQGVNE